MIVRADRGRDVLRTELFGAGASVVEATAYRQIDVKKPAEEVLSALASGAIDYVLLSSGNMAKGFVHCWTIH